MYTKRFEVILLSILLIIIVGALGYMAIEGWSFIEAFYMTVITLTTVGFGEVRQLSDAGRLFTVGLILLGVGTLAYFVKVLVEFIVDGQLVNLLRRKRMKREIDTLEDHCIVCGYGRIGRRTCDILHRRGIPFVVIEKDPDVIEVLRNNRFPFIEGNAHRNEVLVLAGIDRAKALIAAVSSDAENVFVTLTARGLNPNIIIAARLNDPQSEEKLRRAGADFVVSPYHMAGQRLVASVLKPSLADFLDAVIATDELGIDFEEIRVDGSSPMVGKTLSESKIGQEFRVSILAIKRGEKDIVPNPTAVNHIEENDLLIALGTREQLEKLREAAVGKNG